MDFLSLRLSNVGLSATSSVQNKVIERLNSGKKIIGLSVGEPDFDTPKNIKTAAIKAINEGKTKYTASDGNQRLKEAVIKKFQLENDLCYSTNEVIISSGGKQVIFNALLATINEGDEVAIIAPYWVSYPDITKISGGIPKIIQTKFENGFKVTKEDLEKNLSYKTKWLIINSPSNPTGAVYSKEELLKLSSVLKKFTNVNVLSDEIYEHLIYEKYTLTNIVQVSPELKNRTLIVNGVSKAYAMTGWRIGYGAGNSTLISAMKTIQSQSTSSACSVSQEAAREALTGSQNCIYKNKSIFEQRRNLLLESLSKTNKLKILKPSGAFYLMPLITDLIGRKTKEGVIISSDTTFVTELLNQTGVAVVPGSAFGLDFSFRISYATNETNLREASDLIVNFINSLS